MGLILNPEIKMRPDGGRAVLFSVNNSDLLGESVFRFLYPQHAVILSFFDGQRSLSQIKEVVAYLFDLCLDEALEKLERLLDLPVSQEEKIRDHIIESSDKNSQILRVYDPKDFIVPVEKIDMSNIRCNMPTEILILPTMRCYTNCIYCYADRKGEQDDELDFPQYNRLLREAKECSIETVEFSGGDIFSKKDAFDFVEATFSAGLYPVLTTKYPLSRQEIEILAGMGLSTIQISIDAFSSYIIDRMVGREGYGKRILRTLDYLGEAGIKVRTNSVLTPFNIHDAVNLAKHLAQMPHVFKSNFNVYSRSLYKHKDTSFCSLNEIQEFETAFNYIKEEAPEKAMYFSGPNSDPYLEDESKRTKRFWERAQCTANRRGLIVLPNGKVTICEELYFHESFIIGDLNKQSLMEVWNSPKALELAKPDQSLVPDGACKDCPDYQRCHEGLGRCYREVLKAYGYDKPDLPDPRCPRATVGKRFA
jgi:radical SAM protein with 4Fe4S-binding SPASM domain